MIVIKEHDKDSETLKNTAKYVLEHFKILEVKENNENLFSAKIKDEKAFYSILKLFFSLYLLEKLYSQRYPIFLEGNESKELKRELRRYLRSAIPKDRQAYLVDLGGKVVMVTYFGYHDEHVNLFGKRNILVGSFVKAFESVVRSAHLVSERDCPIILAFRYNCAERIHILNKMECELNIKFDDLKCERKNNECSCLKEIEQIILNDSKNRECNLRIFGGAQMFFDVEYDLVRRLVSLEDLDEEVSENPFKKKGYEPIYNFLLACYLSDKLKAKFNTNLKLKFDGVEKEADVILFSDSWVSIIETTREHAVCRKDKYFEKIEKSILASIPLRSLINDDQTFYLVLVTLTPESEFSRCSQYVSFAMEHFNFKHIGIPDESKEFIDNPKYFSPSNTEIILKHQLGGLIEVLKTA